MISDYKSTRREFFRMTLFLLQAMGVSSLPATAAAQTAFVGEPTFHRILHKATTNNWLVLPIGELMGKIALEFVGTPYVSSTLELSETKEICSANLTGLDCVTFFETTLDLARMLKTGGRTPKDLLAQIRLTRYRGGAQDDYISRLHYTSDWFFDNQIKHVVELLSQLPGSESFSQKVGFMSSNPDSYRQLRANPALIAKMKLREDDINNRSLTFVPLAKLAEAEPLLKTGDIVGVCTTQPGIDIAHTGIIFRTEDGVAHFMDASSKKSAMKVTLEPGPIHQVLNWSKNLTGAMFARPLEPQ